MANVPAAAKPCSSSSKSSAERAFDENHSSKQMDLYSRQIGTFGVETMRKLVNLNVLIVGLQGVGAETAKNLILAGPRRVTLCDNEAVRIQDLGTNFCLDPSLVGVSRARASMKMLAELNEYVSVDVLEGGVASVNAELLSQYGAVVVCKNIPLSVLRGWSDICHQHVDAAGKPAPILFLMALTRGVTAAIFADFGPSHRITDPDGEPLRVNVIESMHLNEDGQLIVEVVADQHGLDDDTPISLEEIEGATELNGLAGLTARRVFDPYGPPEEKNTRLNPKRFRVCFPPDCEVSAAQIGTYTRGGIVTPHKKATVLSFLPLGQSVVTPGSLNHPHPEKLLLHQRAPQLHFAYLALWEYQANHGGALPPLHDKQAAEECVKLATSILEEHRSKKNDDVVTVEEIDPRVIRQTVLYAQCELSGICAFLGGVVAQEIVKRFGKYTPVHQWLYLDYFELLSENGPLPMPDTGATRYFNQIAIFGEEFQKKLSEQKWFLVGCGALGCEFLKAFALMGVGCSKTGLIHVTDMDRIELSNLNRQFLFRHKDVGQPKSVAAAAAAKVMNPKLNALSDETRVGPDTEDHFNDQFWNSLTGVCNALDNVEARRYTDSRCVFFEKPLLESGTMGTKAHSEVVVPHMTASYSEQKDNAPKGGIPMCTLRNFPHLIEHCIEWALAKFSDYFVDPAKELNMMKTDRGPFFAGVTKLGGPDMQLEKMESILSMLQKVVKRNYDTCIEMAFDVFEKEFSKTIRDLVYFFPETHEVTDKESGITRPFWSGAKRFPQAATFDMNDELQLNFLFCAANLYATMMNVPVVRDIKVFAERLAALKPTPAEWKPPSRGPDLFEDKEAASAAAKKVEAKKVTMMDVMQCKMKLIRFDGFKELPEMQVADFEKDDDTNFHVDFLTACANLRAWNYRIKLATRHGVKMIAGKIIPAIATTTAMITGLVSLELYKLALNLKLESFCCANINLAIASFQMFEPSLPKKAVREYSNDDLDYVNPIPDGFTCWDRVVVDEGDLTVQEFVDKFPSLHHGVTPEILVPQGVDTDMGNKVLYSTLLPTKSLRELVERNKSRKITEVYEELFGPLPAQNYLILDGSWETADMSPAKIPLVKYVFRHD